MRKIIILVKYAEAEKLAVFCSKQRHYRLYKKADIIFYKIDPEAGLEAWEIDKMMSDEIHQIQKVMRYEPTSGSKSLIDSLHCGGRQQVNSTARAHNQNVVRSWISDHGRKHKPTSKCPLASADQFNYLRGFRP